jgi:hypothetical protein
MMLSGWLCTTLGTRKSPTIFVPDVIHFIQENVPVLDDDVPPLQVDEIRQSGQVSLSILTVFISDVGEYSTPTPHASQKMTSRQQREDLCRST